MGFLESHIEGGMSDEMPWESNESPSQPIFNHGKLVRQMNPISERASKIPFGLPLVNVLPFMKGLSPVLDHFSLCSSCDGSFHVAS